MANYRIRQSPSGKFIDIVVPPGGNGAEWSFLIVPALPAVIPPPVATTDRTLVVVTAAVSGTLDLPSLTLMNRPGFEFAIKVLDPTVIVEIQPVGGDVIDAAVTSDFVAQEMLAIYIAGGPPGTSWFHV